MNTGLIEAGWASEKDPKPHYKLIVDGDPLEPTKESIHHLGKIMVADLQGHDDAIAFLQPVKAEEVPDYAEIIKASFQIQIHILKALLIEFHTSNSLLN